jgi:hypothetical protein
LLATFNDAGFRADAKRINLGVTSPRDGDQLQKLIVDTYRTPPQIVERLRQLSLH